MSAISSVVEKGASGEKRQKRGLKGSDGMRGVMWWERRIDLHKVITDNNCRARGASLVQRHGERLDVVNKNSQYIDVSAYARR